MLQLSYRWFQSVDLLMVAAASLPALWLVLDSVQSTKAQDLEDLFLSRTREEWEGVWHKESHARCRQHLVRHLYWACSKDIYKLSARSNPSNDVKFPFIPESSAKSMLRLRRCRRSITQECCNAVGCTWEEYAEYCPYNKRTGPYNQ